MLFKLSFLALAVAVSAAPSSDQTVFGRPNYDHISYYNCAGKPAGNYLHPSDCTRFIMCAEGGSAADMACPDCNLADNPTQCAGNPYLVYDPSGDNGRGSCEWPSETQCRTGETSSTTETPNPTSERTTEAPTQTPPTPTTTSPPTGTPPTACSVNNRTLVVGDSCEPDDCQPCGICQDKISYVFRCNRTRPADRDPNKPIVGVIVVEQCDQDLWFNPTLKPNSAAYGGNCGIWGLLPRPVQDAYLDDPTCVQPVCEWGQEKDCSRFYWYNDGKGGSNEPLECNPGLAWDRELEICRNCTDVLDNRTGERCTECD